MSSLNSFDRNYRKMRQSSSPSCSSSSICKCCKPLFFIVFCLLAAWCSLLICKVYSIRHSHSLSTAGSNTYLTPHQRNDISVHIRKDSSKSDGMKPVDSISDIKHARSEDKESLDESYHIVFSTGCSQFQDWQSIGVYSSAIAVGQRGIITRIASGCSKDQEEVIRHAMSHLPSNCRVHFAPGTQVRDHSGHIYKYANKPLGMMHWLEHADPPIPPSATVALCDPDFFFLRPLYHDSFDDPSKYFASGKSKKTPMPTQLKKGTMIAQRYGIGGAPWSVAPGKNGQKAWDLKGYFESIGRPNSPALAPDLKNSASAFYSIGAPYIALAEDWLPIATNWTALMPMAVERNFGNLAEMYACSIAIADYGIRPAQIDSLMVSNVNCHDEGWKWVDALPRDRGCDPSVLTQTNPQYPLPTFLHYCQGYKVKAFEAEHSQSPGKAPNWKYTKYQVPNEILSCPAGSKAFEEGKPLPKKKKGGIIHLDSHGLLPEPPSYVNDFGNLIEFRNIFMNCAATRATNQAAKDYRRWFCDVSHT